MKMKSAAIILLQAGLILGCQRMDVKVQRWSQSNNQSPSTEVKAALTTLGPSHLKSHVNETQIYQKTARFGRFDAPDFQIWAIKKKGIWQNASMKMLSSDPSWRARLRAQMLEKKMPSIAHVFYMQNSHLKSLSQRVIYTLTDDSSDLAPAIELTSLYLDESDVELALLGFGGEVLVKKSIAHKQVAGLAQVYPTRPDLSDLVLQTLYDLKGNGRLQNQRVRVESASEETAYSRDHTFTYSTDDPHFDEVQAFYFADSALEWFANQLNVQLAFPLDIKVHMGAPQKTNTAFYYDKKIRLGSGDGVTYQHLSRDPTVVSHEVGHAIIHRLSGLPFEGDGGSINEGFADYFSAEITGESQMGTYSYLPGPYVRNIDNQMTYDQLREQGMYANSLLISGTLWDLHKQFGSSLASQIALHTLLQLGPYAQIHEFGTLLVDASSDLLTAEQLEQLKNLVITKRGFPE